MLRLFCEEKAAVGCDKFICRIETLPGRRLRALSVGRPVKRKGNNNEKINR